MNTPSPSDLIAAQRAALLARIAAKRALQAEALTPGLSPRSVSAQRAISEQALTSAPTPIPTPAPTPKPTWGEAAQAIAFWGADRPLSEAELAYTDWVDPSEDLLVPAQASDPLPAPLLPEALAIQPPFPSLSAPTEFDWTKLNAHAENRFLELPLVDSPDITKIDASVMFRTHGLKRMMDAIAPPAPTLAPEVASTLPVPFSEATVDAVYKKWEAAQTLPPDAKHAFFSFTAGFHAGMLYLQRLKTTPPVPSQPPRAPALLENPQVGCPFIHCSRQCRACVAEDKARSGQASELSATHSAPATPTPALPEDNGQLLLSPFNPASSADLARAHLRHSYPGRWAEVVEGAGR